MKKITLSALFIIIIIIQNQPCQAQCHFNDWTALQAIYESTNGDNWINRTGWDALIVNKKNPPANCNLVDLYGVQSVNQQERVDFLTLSNNNLIGFIPNEIMD